MTTNTEPGDVDRPNAEDCSRCMAPGAPALAYPFICPGHDDAPADAPTPPMAADQAPAGGAGTTGPHEPSDGDPAAPTDDDRTGWYEFLMPGGATTHIAYVYESGAVYLPEAGGDDDPVTEEDFRVAAASRRFWRLVRESEVAARYRAELDRLRGERERIQEESGRRLGMVNKANRELDRLRGDVKRLTTALSVKQLEEIELDQARAIAALGEANAHIARRDTELAAARAARHSEHRIAVGLHDDLAAERNAHRATEGRLDATANRADKAVALVIEALLWIGDGTARKTFEDRLAELRTDTGEAATHE